MHVRDVLGRPVVAEPDQHQRHGPDVLGDAEVLAFALGLGEAGLDEARRHRVHVDVEGAELAGQRPGQTDDAALRGRVVGLPGVPGERGRGRREVDLAVIGRRAAGAHLPLRRLAHVGHRGERRVERGLEVHVEDEVPQLIVEVVEGLVAGDARVVHEDVDLAELGGGRLEHRAGLVELDGVVGGDLGLAAGVLDGLRGLLGGFRVDVVHDDRRALLCQAKGRSPADASAGSGHDRDLSLQSAQDGLLLDGRDGMG